MMRNRLSRVLLLAFLLAFVVTGAALAQEDGAAGSIRGTVYRDTNNDGLCVGTGESGLSGIPVRFNNGSSELYLQSGEDGTFGLVASGLGTWTVSAEPSADQGVVTSAASRSVTLTEENPLASGVDFCVGTTRTSGVVLPESGAPAMPGLWIAAVVALVLVAAGVFMLVRERRTGA